MAMFNSKLLVYQRVCVFLQTSSWFHPHQAIAVTAVTAAQQVLCLLYALLGLEAREVCSKTCANKQLITWHDIWNRCFKKTGYKLYTCRYVYIYIYYIHTCAVYCIACSTIPMKIREFFFRTVFFDASGGLVQDKLAIQGCGWNWGYVPGLVMTNSLLLKMVIYSGFTHWKWWFSIVMWLFTRRYCLVPKMNGLNGESLSQMPLKNKVPGWIWNGWCGKHQEEVERQSWRIS